MNKTGVTGDRTDETARASNSRARNDIEPFNWGFVF